MLWLCLLAGCGGPQQSQEPPPPISAEILFPEGDPSVAAEAGGPGFSPEPESGWQTADAFEPIGSPDAQVGGSLRCWVRFPTTLRIIGKDSNADATRILRELCYESLLTRHSDSLEYIPRLASHWWISADQKTFRFRINPRAHFSDGQPVTSADVIATWELGSTHGILDPAHTAGFAEIEKPIALSKYLVEICCRSGAWRNFQFMADLSILPAHEISGLSGAKFLSRYQFRAPAGSGPYLLREEDVDRGARITLRRRSDYWGFGERFATGLYNFDNIRLISTEDSVLALEKVKKGEIDLIAVGKAKDWAVDLPRLDQVERGLLVMQQVYNDNPAGADGIVMNMRHPPLDDVRVRRALCHLFHRRKLIDKLFYGLYEPLDSYFPAAWEHAEAETTTANPHVRYDPELAWGLLQEAGYRTRNSEGILEKDGQPLELELVYSSKSVERYLSVFQEDCRSAGIKIHLKQLTRASRYQTTYGNRSFQLATQGWGGTIDPAPEASWHSDLAEKKNNSNLAGFADAQVDELCRQYNLTADFQKRAELLRNIDARIFHSYPCVLGWYAPDVRLVYWNKFGQPPGVLERTSDARSAISTWWFDSNKAAALKSARADAQSRLPVPPREVRYWRDKD